MRRKQGIWYLRGKSPKLIAHDLGSELHAWQVDLPKKADNILASEDNIILHSRDGSVGNGETQIFFYDSEWKGNCPSSLT